VLLSQEVFASVSRRLRLTAVRAKVRALIRAGQLNVHPGEPVGVQVRYVYIESHFQHLLPDSPLICGLRLWREQQDVEPAPDRLLSTHGPEHRNRSRNDHEQSGGD
jgi:hypothetical protein